MHVFVRLVKRLIWIFLLPIAAIASVHGNLWVPESRSWRYGAPTAPQHLSGVWGVAQIVLSNDETKNVLSVDLKNRSLKSDAHATIADSPICCVGLVLRSLLIIHKHRVCIVGARRIDFALSVTR